MIGSTVSRPAALLILTILMVAAAIFARTRPIEDGTDYVGSSTCTGCHGIIHAEWSHSEHTQMMRPVGGPGVVVADFGVDDPGLRFEREDAVWAIGGKWEQQFMGYDGTTETLLPGAWLGLVGHWDFQGWDGWQVPVPLKRCHGCHTVGLDVEKGSFAEANIGCEACHGPGGWHVRTQGLGRIYSGVDADVCGQCHSRGTSTSHEYFFPVGYRPGKHLDDYLVEAEPSLGQNSSYFWGNGRPRKRHQERLVWRRGGHADSLKSLKEGYDGRFGAVTSDCLRCHAGEAALTPERNWSLDEVADGVTCSVCHNVHGHLTEARIDCSGCHTEGAFYHTPERNARHIPCPATAKVGCVDCHMPKSVAIGGGFALHDHAPGIIPPQDTLRWSTPSSCANGGCHASTATEDLVRVFDAFYGAEVGNAERKHGTELALAGTTRAADVARGAP